MRKKLLELYHYRELLKNLVASEIKLRYRRSALGFVWTMLNPLLMMVVLTVAFSTVMKAGVKDYAIFLVAALFPWIFFSQAVNLSLMSLVGKGSLLQKVYIPKATIPLSAVLSSLVNFLLALIPLFILLLISGRGLSAALFFLPVAIAIIALFACGVAFVFSSLNVFYRDFGHMTEVVLQLWFYGSPIIYRVTNLPENYHRFFLLNPMTHILECFRCPIFDGRMPDVPTVLIAASAALVMFFSGALVFFRCERHFVFWV